MMLLVPALAGFFGGVLGASLVLYVLWRRPPSPDVTRLRETSSSWSKLDR